MNARLRGKTLLVTGAARGIGAALARRAAAEGARVALVGLEPERLAALAAELGPAHPWFECDVTDQPSLARATSAAVAALGGLDAVVANAGIASNGTVAVTPVEALARTIEVNLTGVVRTVSAALPHLLERRGYALLVSSAAAFRALPAMSAYAASKSGVEAFGAALRAEVAHRGVAVGVAHPSWIDTDLVRDVMGDLPTFRASLRQMPGPLGRLTSVEACAAALVDAIARRRRKVYVPASLALWAALRPLLAGRLGDWVVERRARAAVPALERESRALGRSFGATSAEAPRAPGGRAGG